MCNKIVYVTPVVQLYFYEATIILFVWKENKNNDFIQQFYSSSFGFHQKYINLCSEDEQRCYGRIIYMKTSFAKTDNSVFNNFLKSYFFSLCIPINLNQTAVGLNKNSYIYS